MSIRLNTIIQLETNRRYVVLYKTGYQGRTYYLLMDVDSENDIMICYESLIDGETYINWVKDVDLINQLMEQFMPQIMSQPDEG